MLRVQPGALALGEVRARLQQQVAAGEGAQTGEGPEHLRGQGAAAGAELEDVPAAQPPDQPSEHLGALGGEAGAEQGRDLGRGDEVAARAELGRAGDVIAQPGGVEGQIHEAVEGQGTPGGGDLGAHVRVQSSAQL